MVDIGGQELGGRSQAQGNIKAVQVLELWYAGDLVRGVKI